MAYLPQIIFLLVLLAGIGFFTLNIRQLIKNIKLGRSVTLEGSKRERYKNVALIAFGQSKMLSKPVSGILHLVVYLGFLIINIEVLEIIIDGLFGTHRIFAFLGTTYNVLIATFEILAALVVVAVAVFWLRRNVLKLSRFWKPEMKGWPKKDANLILYIEWVLMGLFLIMNAADLQLQQLGADYYVSAGAFPVSSFISPLLDGMSVDNLTMLERGAWWLHIIGILCFLNYLYYSKHLHIMLAFPNTYFGKLTPSGQFAHNETVAKEVALMMDPNADPFAASAADAPVPERFGAADVMDLNQIQLLNAYTCTECGRCTSECPANQTGKKLSPRKIMMDTRDRLQEVGENTKLNKGEFKPDGKQLLGDYISAEELWACTSCNACIEACPVSIDPLSIIMDMRQYLVMEQSAAPAALNNMMGNIENNGAPWPYNQQDRLQWAQEN